MFKLLENKMRNGEMQMIWSDDFIYLPNIACSSFLIV